MLCASEMTIRRDLNAESASVVLYLVPVWLPLRTTT
ncbi:hypothetical protein [Sodalis-like endosymbiont of Proechinophthirus fluctus]